MLLFDLNLEFLPPNNLAQNIVKNRGETSMQSVSFPTIDLSETSSSSSVVNADESPIPDDVAGASSPAFVTRQLFPLTVELAEQEVARVGSSPTSNNNRWLNLSGSSFGSGVGLGSGVGSNPVRKNRRGPRSRSSQYRGVTFYRRTGRWESHIWDCGKQVYLGGFDTANAAARAYDRAAIKFRGVDADINFSITDYDDDMKQAKNLSKEEFVHLLRRQNTGSSRGSSRYRGGLLPKCGGLESPIGQFPMMRASEQAAVANFEPSTYSHQIPLLANSEGHGHNLDLNLGISITIDGPKARNYMGVGESQPHQCPIQLANGKIPMNRASPYYSSGVMPLYGQPMASRQTSVAWSGLAQSRHGTYEEKTSEEKPAATQSNWAWYMERQGQGGGTPNEVQLLSARAASSGFPFSTTTKDLTTSATLFTQSHSNNDTSTSLHQYGQGR